MTGGCGLQPVRKHPHLSTHRVDEHGLPTRAGRVPTQSPHTSLIDSSPWIDLSDNDRSPAMIHFGHISPWEAQQAGRRGGEWHLGGVTSIDATPGSPVAAPICVLFARLGVCACFSSLPIRSNRHRPAFCWGLRSIHALIYYLVKGPAAAVWRRRRHCSRARDPALWMEIGGWQWARASPPINQLDRGAARPPCTRACRLAIATP